MGYQFLHVEAYARKAGKGKAGGAFDSLDHRRGDTRARCLSSRREPGPSRPPLWLLASRSRGLSYRLGE